MEKRNKKMKMKREREMEKRKGNKEIMRKKIRKNH